jgi:SAM-dependent methyltransferase
MELGRFNMDHLQLLVELHKDAARQGPGGDEETRMSIALSGLSTAKALTIADIGCGTGASTMVLAQCLDTRVTAVDFIPEFLAKLEAAAARNGAADRIKTVSAPMDDLPFEEGEFDAIWSEGAIYNMGFEAGISAWRRYLKPGGVLAVSELTWLTHDRPAELQAHWEREYSQVDTASAKMAVLEKHGYSPVGYFALPDHCWLDNYYRPMEQRFASFLAAYADAGLAHEIIESERREISLYERFRAFFGYGYYIARKTAG